MSESATPRWALPLLAAGQAEKELTHNEALLLLDMAVQPSVVAVGSRSFTLAAEIRDPASGTVYARARTVAVGPRPLDEAERRALGRFALPDATGVPAAAQR